MGVFDFINEDLEEIKKEGLFRTIRPIEWGSGVRIKINGKKLINFCSNNYLGLSNDPRVVKKTSEILEKFGVGAGASRLVSGNFKVHEELERRISRFEGTEASIVFPTGYMANIGTIQALVGAGDAIIIDRLNHASIIDGARLSGAKLLVYPHKDMMQLEKILKNASGFKKKLIVTDHVFSMDGDIAPVKELLELSLKHDAMFMLDTAHSTGILDLKVKDMSHLIIMGTLSKTTGSLGGFISGKRDLIDYLRNKARSFIYTTGLPPSIAAASIASFDIISRDKSLRNRLWHNVKYLKQKMNGLDLDTLGSQTQIVPILIGDAVLTIEVSNNLFCSGIFLSAIRPPTVPKGTSRLRLTLTAMHEEKDIDYLVSKLREAKEIFLG